MKMMWEKEPDGHEIKKIIDPSPTEEMERRIERLKEYHKRHAREMKVTLEKGRREGQSFVRRIEEYRGRVKIIEYRPRPIISSRGIDQKQIPNLRRWLYTF